MKNQFLAALVQLLKDKNGNHSLREVATAIFVLVLLVSWVAEQFFDKQMPEYMFYAFVSLVGPYTPNSLQRLFLFYGKCR